MSYRCDNQMPAEILIQDKKQIKLARVLLKFDTPLKKYPQFGVWSYLIASANGVIIFDAGPKYPTFSLVKRQTLNNTQRILKALERFFPQQPVSSIVISHYHFDHSENAPDLQAKLCEKYGFLPLIYLHEKEFENKMMFHLFPTNLNQIFRHAGYQQWKFGPAMHNNDLLADSSFYVWHAPGHTSGNIALVSDQYKVIIGGWWLTKIRHPLVNFMQKFLIDEDRKDYVQTLNRIKNYSGYKYYYYHPKIY